MDESPQAQSFHCPTWDGTACTPVVDGKYVDRNTGKVKDASGPAFLGPPAVDIIIHSIDEKTMNCGCRAQRPVAVEAVLWRIANVVNQRALAIDSLTITPYAVRLTLAHPMTPKDFYEICDRITDDRIILPNEHSST